MFLRLLFCIGLLCIACPVFATNPEWGLTYAQVLVNQDPPYLKGFRLATWYQPPRLVGKNSRFLFELGWGHWWVTQVSPHCWQANNHFNKNLNTLAISPVWRFYFLKNNALNAFFNASIGLTYLSQTRFADRNLGMHFAFQDQLGLGLTLGKLQKFSVSLSALHYSNGSLCKYNAGMTIPLMLNVEYGF